MLLKLRQIRADSQRSVNYMELRGALSPWSRFGTGHDITSLIA